MKRVVFAAALTCAGLMANGAQASVNFLLGAVLTGASATASDGVGVDSKSKMGNAGTFNFSDLIPGITASSFVSAHSGEGRAAASADDLETLTLTASAPDSGAFDFTGLTHAALGAAASSSAYAEAGANGALGLYVFAVVGEPTPFVVTYATTGSTDAGLSYLAFLKTSSSFVGAFGAGANDSGTVSYLLNPGDYVFGVLELGSKYGPDSIYAGEPGDSLTGESSGTFRWTSAVPEPATWVAISAGFLAMAFVARRRRTVLAA